MRAVLFAMFFGLALCATFSAEHDKETSHGDGDGDSDDKNKIPSQTEGNSTTNTESIRLPGDLRPTLYNLTLRVTNPIKDDQGQTVQLTLYCLTQIYMDCVKDTEEIWIHFNGKTVEDYEFEERMPDGSLESITLGFPKYDESKEMVVFSVEPELKSGHHYILTLLTTSLVVEGFEGMYISPYKEEGEHNYILITMMEPTDARKVFPCFDEPDYKAVFLFNIYRQEHETSLTNLPLRETIPFDDGFFLDVFDEPRTVPMSTYLVAIAIGKLAHKEAWLNNTKIRTWSRESAVNLTDFALDVGVKTMDFFEKYFQIEYKLPKQDMIAVPTMSFNAMEHWGLITYRESGMFFDDLTSSVDDKEWTTILVAHEVSHQWFGNLVSPYWWDDLWLNEGFATYMMFLAADAIFPEWQMITEMTVNFRGTQNVFIKDSTLTSHPVYVDVNHPMEIKEIFDLISYAKGAALIKMMNIFLGEDTFRRGLTRYLTDLSFKTATHNDLWYALGNQSIVDGLAITNVKEVMDGWILEKNYPLVDVIRNADGTVTLTQMPFLMSAEERQERGIVCWNIPFIYTTDDTADFGRPDPSDIVWLKDDCADVSIATDDIPEAQWILGNVQQFGYFRVTYDVANWDALFEQLQTDHTVIHPVNRAQLISDSSNLARAGLLDHGLAMKVYLYLHREREYAPWRAAIRELDLIDGLLQLSPVYGNFQRFMKAKLEAPFLAALTAEPSHYNTKLLSLLEKSACKYGVKSCVNDAKAKFDAWMRDPENVRLDANHQDTIFCMGVRFGGEEAVRFLLERLGSLDNNGEHLKLISALSCTQTPWIVQMLLSLSLQNVEGLSIVDSITLMELIAETPIGRLLVWNFLDQNWETLFESYGSGLNMFPRLIDAVTGNLNTELELKRLQELIAAKDSLGTATRIFHTAVKKVRNQIDATKHLLELFGENSPFLEPINSF